jgi:hypothetical protein
MRLAPICALFAALISSAAWARMSPSMMEAEVQQATKIANDLTTLKSCEAATADLVPSYLDLVHKHMKMCDASETQFDQIEAIHAKGTPVCARSSHAQYNVQRSLIAYTLGTAIKSYCDKVDLNFERK